MNVDTYLKYLRCRKKIDTIPKVRKNFNELTLLRPKTLHTPYEKLFLQIQVIKI